MRRAVETDVSPVPRGPYSKAIVAGGRMLYVGGQEPFDPLTNQPVGGSISDQTVRTLLNLQAIIEAAGGRLENAVKVTVYLSDLSYFEEFNQAYSKFFPAPPPARTTIRCDLPGFDIEIDAIVALDV